MTNLSTIPSNEAKSLNSLFTNYSSLSSKDLDKNFYHNLKFLISVMNKLPDANKKAFTNLLANIFGNYLEQKIDREITASFEKILKF